MQTRSLTVTGAHEFRPTVFTDHRGLFVAPFQGEVFADTVGRTNFPVAQAAHSRSRRGVLRGVHYTRTPPGMATYVTCTRGSVLDFAVDLRVGSPTFGAHDSTVLDAETCNALYLPVGAGHAFLALEDDTVVSYLLSGGYIPENERAVHARDPDLGLAVPTDIPLVQSERDRQATSVAAAKSAGDLPDYSHCLDVGQALWT